MSNYYLTVARKYRHSDKKKLEGFLKKYSAEKDPEFGVAYVFSSEKSFAVVFADACSTLRPDYELALTDRPDQQGATFNFARSSVAFARRLGTLKEDGVHTDWNLVQGTLEDKLEERDKRIDAQ